MQELYEKYKDKGLEIFAFPCNQFKNQEPLKGMEILKHYKDEFKIGYPVSMKIKVNGANADPLFKYLKEKAPHAGFGSLKEKALLWPILRANHPEFLEGDEIKWNYTKFLVANGGETIERYEPSVTPKDIEKRVAELLE